MKINFGVSNNLKIFWNISEEFERNFGDGLENITKNHSGTFEGIFKEKLENIDQIIQTASRNIFKIISMKCERYFEENFEKIGEIVRIFFLRTLSQQFLKILKF